MSKLIQGQSHQKLNKRKKKLDLRTPQMIKERIINLHSKYAMQPKDIAKTLEVPRNVVNSRISEYLEEYRENRAEVEQFKLNRADIFSVLQKKSAKLLSSIIDSIDPNELQQKEKSFMVNALNAVIGTVYDKERIERGQTTNTASTLAVIIQQVANDRMSNNIIEHENKEDK